MDRYEHFQDWSGGKMVPDDDGDWIKWEDHQAIIAQHETRNATTTMKSIEIKDSLRALVAELEARLAEEVKDSDRWKALAESLSFPAPE